MTNHFADFLTTLNNEGVAYVVIGGIAVIRHVPYRTTRDIDVLIEPRLENAERVRAAVTKWAGLEPDFPAEDFISGDILSFGGHLRIDIHSRVPGAEWDQVWKRREPGEFGGVQTFFASLDDLISMKKASGHPNKDLPDIDRLKKLRESKGS